MLGEVKDLVKVFEVTPDGIKQGLAAESSKMNEVIYSNPGKASDDFVEVPLKDSEDNKVTIKLNNIDWDIDSVVNKFYDGESIDIDELPDTLECDIDLEDYANIPVEDINSIISLVKDKVFEKTGLRINNADYIAA